MNNRIPPPILLLLTGTLMWLVSRSSFNIPFDIQNPLIPSLALGGAGILIDLLALRQFRAAQTTVNPLRPHSATSLVCEGVFRYSRNPMYVGLVLILSGWSLWLGSLSNIGILFVFIGLITQFQIKPEEVALRALFGEAYSAYCLKVRRWI